MNLGEPLIAFRSGMSVFLPLWDEKSNFFTSARTFVGLPLISVSPLSRSVLPAVPGTWKLTSAMPFLSFWDSFWL